MKRTLVILLALALLTFGLAITNTQAATLCVNPGGTGGCYSSIQAAVNAAASSGDTINVSAGTYVEQVVITKSLTLVGAGTSSTTIQAPAGIPPASNPDSVIVKISGAGVSADLSGFNVSGPGPSGCGSILAGVFVRDNAFANIHDNKIVDVRDSTLSGCQNGIGILIGRALWSTTGSATISNNTLQTYQKGGIVVSGAGSDATITGNAVVGIGATSLIAQNGIQISGGATGTVTGNTVSGHSYTPFTWSSAGILPYAGSSVNTSGNTLTENQVGIYVVDTAGIYNADTIHASGAGTGSPGFWGIIIDSPPPSKQPSPFPDVATTSVGRAPRLVSASQTVTVTNSTLTGDNTNAGTGLEVDGGFGDLNINLVAKNNFVTNWGTGFMLYQCVSSCTASSILTATVSYNSITTNTVGLNNPTGLVVDATRNWWGSGAGPGGGQVLGNATISPWLCLGVDTQPATPGFQPNTAPCWANRYFFPLISR